jgi:Peptidase family M28
MLQILFAALVLSILATLAAAFGFFVMPGHSFVGRAGTLLPEAVPMRKRLEAHVRTLAEIIGERHYQKLGSLEQAAHYIEGCLNQVGYEVRSQHYGPGAPMPFRNLEVELRGIGRPEEIVILAAHYDTVKGSPGADDNATGIAALLELAHEFYGQRLSRTLRFVAFVNEEEPFAETERMGSRIYARAVSARGDRIVGMIALESIGYYRDEPGSQRYPVPIRWFYPDTGTFLAFVGNFASRDLVRRTIASFRTHAQLPSEGIAIPEALVPDINRSDHASFWRYGYPAIMVTDTAPFRNPHYHSDEDLPETLDFERLSLAVLGMKAVLSESVKKLVFSSSAETS